MASLGLILSQFVEIVHDGVLDYLIVVFELGLAGHTSNTNADQFKMISIVFIIRQVVLPDLVKALQLDVLHHAVPVFVAHRSL